MLSEMKPAAGTVRGLWVDGYPALSTIHSRRLSMRTPQQPEMPCSFAWEKRQSRAGERQPDRSVSTAASI